MSDQNRRYPLKEREIHAINDLPNVKITHAASHEIELFTTIDIRLPFYGIFVLTNGCIETTGHLSHSLRPPSN